MPPSSYCKPRWIKAGGRSTGHSLAPSTQIQFMNNQSKKCLSEQHCGSAGLFAAGVSTSQDDVAYHAVLAIQEVDRLDATA